MNKVNFQQDLIEKLISGRSAYVHNRLGMVTYLLRIFETFGKLELIKTLHVSKECGGFMHYFIAATSIFDEKKRQNLNDIYTIFSELNSI